MPKKLQWDNKTRSGRCQASGCHHTGQVDEIRYWSLENEPNNACGRDSGSWNCSWSDHNKHWTTVTSVTLEEGTERVWKEQEENKSGDIFTLPRAGAAACVRGRGGG